MVNRNFPIHGSLNICVESGLMIIRARGPANTEMVLQYQREVNQYREQLSHKPWASLTVLSGEPMNLVATAIVFDDVQYKSISEQFWEGIYQRTTLKHAFFDDELTAKAWLKKQVAERHFSTD